MRRPSRQAHFSPTAATRCCSPAPAAATAAGRTLDLTRWRADTTLENWGTWIYLQDRESGASGRRPILPHGATPDAECSVLFSPDTRGFPDPGARGVRPRGGHGAARGRSGDPPRDPDALRAPARAGSGDQLRAKSAWRRRRPTGGTRPSTPCSSRASTCPDLNALLFPGARARPQKKPHLTCCTCWCPEGHARHGGHETDRGRFLGRGGSVRDPAALREGAPARRHRRGHPGPDLVARPGDRLAPGRERPAGLPHDGRADSGGRCWTWRRATATGRWSRAPSTRRARRASARCAGSTSARQQLETIQQLSRCCSTRTPALRADPAVARSQPPGQNSLWRFGISGDYPILLARIPSAEHTGLVAELLRAHAYWRSRRLRIELVFLEPAGGYTLRSSRPCIACRLRGGSDAWLNRRGGIFLLQSEQMSPAERSLLQSAARVVLDGARGALGEQLKGVRQLARPAARPRPGHA